MKTTRFILASLLLIPSLAAQAIHVVNGNVGIGTANPTRKLVVEGPGEQAIELSSTGTGARRYGLVVNPGWASGSLHLYDFTGDSSRLTVSSGGNVGIGTTSPGAKLDVAGDGNEGTADIRLSGTGGSGGIGAASGQVRFYSPNGGLGVMLDDSSLQAYGGKFLVPSGNVGIGTTSPGALLDVYGALGSTRVSGNQVTHIYNAEANPRWQIDRDAGGSGLAGIKFGAGGASAVDTTIARITGGGVSVMGGNVGIGTTSPIRSLQVNGELSITRSDRIAFFNVSDPAGNGSGTIWLRGLTSNGSAGADATILLQGNVGIGTTNPTHKLTVNGQVKAKGFLADTSNWADFVFEPDYRLAPLPEVEAHIREKGHLPGIPSATEVKTQGVDLMAMQVKLLQKVEELTLHLIRMEKENAALQQRVQSLEGRR